MFNHKKGYKIELFDENGVSRGYFDLRNQINELTGKEWVFSTKSVIPKSFPPSFQQKLRNQHGGQKPPELCEMIIRTFTKRKDIVLDPFAGVGGTLLGCYLAKRIGIGIEINKKWIDIYHEVCRLEKIPPQEMIMGDSRRVIPERFKDSETIDFILTDVPFWKMDIVKKSKGVFKKVGEPSKGVYSDKSKLSKFNEDPKMQIRSMEEWMDLLKVVFTHCYEILKPGKYCAVFIGNMYHGGRYYLLNADLASILEKIGFVLKGEYVWYDVAKKLHLYGINYAWIPSLTHQFIMIFRKERNGPLTEEEKKKLIARNLKIAKSNKKKSSGMSRLKI